ncbi:MAG: winged helix DNA-binding protein [Pseudomonadota bacterium]|nr:winged helix DNA-binding protein [Pseudomonadota bacterium]
MATTEDFAYDASAHDVAGQKLSLSIFADRVHIRDQLREDAQAAGFRIAEANGLAALPDDGARPLGEVVLLDIPEVDGAVLAALARIDMRCAHADAALVVSTSIAALDDVFGCLDQSNPQILVNPSRAERFIALGQVLVRLPGGRVRELSEGDRLMLLRLTEQVSQMAQRIENFNGPGSANGRDVNGSGDGSDSAADEPAKTGGAFRFKPITGASEAAVGTVGGLARTTRPPLPDAPLVRRIIRQRQQRGRFFEGDLFADPAWDMLLDLTAARAEHSRVSVTSLCIASGVPPTTALRWIGQLTEAGLLQRHEDETDRRRAFITLTDKAIDAMSGFFARLGDTAMRVV